MKAHTQWTGRGLVAAVGVLALTLTGCSGGGDAGSDGESPIVIGITTSQTGVFASLGIDHEFGIRAGVDLATDGTNEIDGRPIEFVVVDDGSDAGAVPAQVRGLIQQDQPDVVFGPLSSSGAVAAAPVLADAGMPAVFTIAATDELTGFSEYTFRTSRNAVQEAQLGATVADIGEGDSFLVLAPDYAYGQSAAASWQELLADNGGVAVSDPIFAPIDARDYTAVAERVRNAAPDLLVVVTFAGSGGPTLWQNLGDAGIADSSDIVTLLPQRATLEALGDLAPKLRYFAIYHQNVPGALNEEFVAKFMELSGEEPDIYAGDSGVAGMMIVDALRAAGTDSDALATELSGMTGESIKGPYEVRAEDHTFLQGFYEAAVAADGTVSIVKSYTLEESVIPVTKPIQ